MDANSVMLLLLKATLLLAIAFAAVRWERTSPAARRHGVWSATFVALLALPLLALSLPGVHIPVPAWLDAPSTVLQRQAPAPLTSSTTDVAPTAHPIDVRQWVTVEVTGPIKDFADRASPNRPQLLVALWLAGVLAALYALGRSLFRVHRLVKTGRQLNNAGWHQAVERIATLLRLDTMPSLIVSEDVSAPMASDIGRPIVFLPADAAQWDADRRDVVLTHEMTHLARRDPLRILTARIACALYWFHPLMWIAARRSTADCEQAVDESVVSLGIRPSVYARVLLDFADQAHGPVPGVALPIVRRHRLENRLMAILSSPGARSRQKSSVGRTVLPALGSVVLILSIAAARPATLQSVSGTGLATAPEVQQPVAHVVAPARDVRQRVSEVETPAPIAGEAGVPASNTVASQGGSCWNAYARSRNFTGSSTTTYGDRLIQRIGIIDGERIAQMTFGDLRICMVTYGYTDGASYSVEPSEWIGRADRVVMETEYNNDLRRLEIEGGRSSFSINGRTAGIDDGVGAWRRALLDLLDSSWEINVLRGEESSLRGEVSSIQGERSSLLGEISSLRGEVSSMQGEISSLRGEESSMRGEISSIRGHESSLRGQISNERGAISSLESQRWDRGADRDAILARIRRHEDNIRDIEREIDRYDVEGRVRSVERRIRDFDVERKVADVERRIRDFDVERKVADVERRIADLNVERRVRGIETDIRDLNVDSRVRDMSGQREAALDRLRRVLGIR